MFLLTDPSSSVASEQEQDGVVSPGRFRTIKAKISPCNPPINIIISTQSTQGMLPKEARKRRKINQEGDNYQQTRKVGVCARCWIRQVKCDSLDHCDRCANESIPRELCCRDRVKDLVNHRPGLASKFIDSYEDSIVRWTRNGQKKRVQLWHGLRSSFTFEVMEYTPQKEIKDLWWKSPSGWQKLVHTPFGIRNHLDIDPTAFDAYTFEQIPLLLNQIEERYKNHQNKFPNRVDVSSNTKGGVMWLRTMRSVYAIVEETPSTQQMLRSALLLWAYTLLQYHALWQFTEDDNHDKLGMSQLALESHDCETLTRFSGATPPPILLRQQIHACTEVRMANIEKSLTMAVHDTYRKVGKSRPGADRVTLYLTTWVYLSVLEEIVWDAHRWKNLDSVSRHLLAIKVRFCI